jgi:hypothetical protein
MAARPPNRTPRYRPAPNAYRPGIAPPSPRRADPPPPPDLDPVRGHLAAHETCQWQKRSVRCVAEAVDVVASREGVLRSSCAQHLTAWLRTGARLVGREGGR